MRRKAIAPVFATPLVMSCERLYEALVQRLLVRFRAVKAIDVTCTTNLGYDFRFADVKDFEHDMFMIARTLGRMKMVSCHIGRWFFGVMRAPAKWAKRVELASPGMICVLWFYIECRAYSQVKFSSLPEGVDASGERGLALHQHRNQHRRTRHCICNIHVAQSPREARTTQERNFRMRKSLSRLLSYQELKEINRLHAVVQEAFLMSHSVAGRLLGTAPDNEINFRDLIIPKGVTVSFSKYDTYLDPKIFPKPHISNRSLDPNERKRLRKYVNNSGRGTLAVYGWT
ncbi:Putative cytochrome P450 [Colletotrichum destructivum]|uniref:Cytochrome P450 n=1 Tax=Colletotrichum destructivum TaxID=34406 RepID=A0AAX4J4C5_9PEZI|nr:Putative cytochrome P450 [Colletotrichum destructivum]